MALRFDARRGSSGALAVAGVLMEEASEMMMAGLELEASTRGATAALDELAEEMV